MEHFRNSDDLPEPDFSNQGEVNSRRVLSGWIDGTPGLRDRFEAYVSAIKAVDRDIPVELAPWCAAELMLVEAMRANGGIE